MPRTSNARGFHQQEHKSIVIKAVFLIEHVSLDVRMLRIQFSSSPRWQEACKLAVAAARHRDRG